ncbi:MAG: serine protease [Oligoflexia bacterium]|nr:serine protease [Oligoflexia bacterium]
MLKNPLLPLLPLSLAVALSARAEIRPSLEEFLSKMVDPEHPSVSEAVRKKAASVVSMGNGDGDFSVAVPPDFQDRKVRWNERGGHGEIPMTDALRTVFGSSHFWRQGSSPDYWTVSPSHDEVLSILKSKGEISPNMIQWRASPFEKNLPDGRDLPGNGHCTGFLVSQNLVMTNHHCISSEEKCGITAFRFNEELGPDLKSIKPLDAYKCNRIVFTDDELDVSLVEVDGNPGQKYAALSLTDREPQSPRWLEDGWTIWPFPKRKYREIQADRLTVIGHPGDHPAYPEGPDFRTIKKISAPCEVTGGIRRVEQGWAPDAVLGLRRNYDIEKLLDPTSPELHTIDKKWISFSSNCFGAGGSSGSPVFDLDLNVIGILHMGSWGKMEAIPMSEIFKRYGASLAKMGIRPATTSR